VVHCNVPTLYLPPFVRHDELQAKNVVFKYSALVRPQI